MWSVKVAGTTACDSFIYFFKTSTSIFGNFNGTIGYSIPLFCSVCELSAYLFTMDSTVKRVDDHFSSSDDEYDDQGATLVSSTVTQDLIGLDIVSLIGKSFLAWNLRPIFIYIFVIAVFRRGYSIGLDSSKQHRWRCFECVCKRRRYEIRRRNIELCTKSWNTRS